MVISQFQVHINALNYYRYIVLLLDELLHHKRDVHLQTVIAVCSQRMRNASGIDDGSMVMTKTEKSRVHFKI